MELTTDFDFNSPHLVYLNAKGNFEFARESHFENMGTILARCKDFYAANALVQNLKHNPDLLKEYLTQDNGKVEYDEDGNVKHGD